VGNNHNPVIEGWYADPEGIIFDQEYWIYPTYSAPYEEQVFLDAFSSKDLVNWEKHEGIIDTSAVKWAWRAMWAPAIVAKDGKYFLFFAANDIQNNEESDGNHRETCIDRMLFDEDGRIKAVKISFEGVDARPL
jgi:beta-xylosidase